MATSTSTSPSFQRFLLHVGVSVIFGLITKVVMKAVVKMAKSGATLDDVENAYATGVMGFGVAISVGEFAGEISKTIP